MENNIYAGSNISRQKYSENIEITDTYEQLILKQQALVDLAADVCEDRVDLADANY